MPSDRRARQGPVPTGLSRPRSDGRVNRDRFPYSLPSASSRSGFGPVRIDLPRFLAAQEITDDRRGQPFIGNHSRPTAWLRSINRREAFSFSIVREENLLGFQYQHCSTATRSNAVARGASVPRSMGACGDDKFSIAQCVQCRLHRTLGEACLLRDHAQAHRHRTPAPPRRAPKQEEINRNADGC